MRLVARINDRAIKGGFQAHFVFDEVSSLRDLEPWNLRLLSKTHASSTAHDRSSNKKRSQSTNHIVEVNTAGDLVVLVSSVGGALTVRIVLHQDDRTVFALERFFNNPACDHLAGTIIERGFKSTQRFWSGILRMSVVDIQACTVRQNRGGLCGQSHFFWSWAFNLLTTTRRRQVIWIVRQQRGVGGRT